MRRASVKFAMTRALSASESKSIVEMVEAIKQNAALVSFGTLWEACICARLTGDLWVRAWQVLVTLVMPV